MIGQVYDLLNLVWKTYHFSPKSMRELRELGTDIGVNANAQSGVKGTRWLPHVSRSLETFLKQGKDHALQSPGQFTAVYLHMDHLAGASANAEIAGRAKKIKLTIEDGTFVAFCHFLADLFSYISQFSLLLQRNDIILPQAVSGIENLLVTIEALAAQPKPGGKLSTFCAAMQEQRHQNQDNERQEFKFQEVNLSKGEAAKLVEGESISQAAPGLQRAIERTCESTVKHLRNRLSSLLEKNTKDTPTTTAVQSFNAFNHHAWPDDKRTLWDHSVKDVEFLLEHFSTVLRRCICTTPTPFRLFSS
ncbi:zinc finger protein 862-like isoform X2 [Megalobrama amblycephala]|uniref:zinc finger protein 862-like isoform X2 n=1 Tax=Megalobrama amblycephala TaxID=75352 RepID=UPI002013E671|nr:zinc finger protein 862-like isoform X2 [Megalobrama amblycephala]